LNTRTLAASWLVAAGLACAGVRAAPAGAAMPAESWEQAREALALTEVGSARLRWLIFRIYDATLWTPSGRFQGLDSDQPKALEISYLRDISAERILEITAREWARLGIGDESDRRRWISQLRGILPDVSRGTRLVAMVLPDGRTRFFDRDGGLGEITEEGFGQRFLAIWLHPDARAARLRRALIGAGNS